MNSETQNEPLTLHFSKLDPSFEFCLDSIGWIVRIDGPSGKITLNREKFPEWKPDDFVLAFCDILEKTVLNPNRCVEKYDE